VTAAVALDPNEAVLEAPAAQVVPELVHHEVSSSSDRRELTKDRRIMRANYRGDRSSFLCVARIE